MVGLRRWATDLDWMNGSRNSSPSRTNRSRPQAVHALVFLGGAQVGHIVGADGQVVMGELLNLVGLSTGIVLYAMLLTMVARAAEGAHDRRIGRSAAPCHRDSRTDLECLRAVRCTSCRTSGVRDLGPYLPGSGVFRPRLPSGRRRALGAALERAGPRPDREGCVDRNRLRGEHAGGSAARRGDVAGRPGSRGRWVCAC